MEILTRRSFRALLISFLANLAGEFSINFWIVTLAGNSSTPPVGRDVSPRHIGQIMTSLLLDFTIFSKHSSHKLWLQAKSFGFLYSSRHTGQTHSSPKYNIGGEAMPCWRKPAQLQDQAGSKYSFSFVRGQSSIVQMFLFCCSVWPNTENKRIHVDSKFGFQMKQTWLLSSFMHPLYCRLKEKRPYEVMNEQSGHRLAEHWLKCQLLSRIKIPSSARTHLRLKKVHLRSTFSLNFHQNSVACAGFVLQILSFSPTTSKTQEMYVLTTVPDFQDFRGSQPPPPPEKNPGYRPSIVSHFFQKVRFFIS